MTHLFLQGVKFSAVGVLSAMVDFGLYLTLTRLWPWSATHIVITSVATSFVAMTVGFLNNRRWTFSARAAGDTAYLRYLLVYSCGAIWQSLLLGAFVTFGLHDVIAKVVAVLLVAYGWNFLLAKFWIFRYTGHTRISAP